MIRGSITNFAEDEILEGELPGNVNYGIQGPPGPKGPEGGYYIPAVTQMDENTIQFTFEPSNPDMPVVDPATAELPALEADWNAAEGEPGHILNRPFYSEYGEETVILPETTITVEGMTPIEYPLFIIAGEEYTVSWNRTVYHCTAVSYSDDGMEGTVLGDLGMITNGVPTTGEPFVLLVFSEEYAATEGFSGVIVPLDGATELTISITGPVETVTPIPKKYLPELRGQKKYVLDLDNGTTPSLEELCKLDTAEIQASLVCIHEGVEKSVIIVNRTDGYYEGMYIADLHLYVPLTDGKYNYYRWDTISGFRLIEEYWTPEMIEAGMSGTFMLVRQQNEAVPNWRRINEVALPGIVLSSTTQGSSKKFLITADDKGALYAQQPGQTEKMLIGPGNGGNVDLTGYATEQWVQDQNYLTEVPEGFAKDEDIPTDDHIIELIQEHAPENGFSVNADWNAEEGEPGYILNKPFGEGKTVLAETIIDVDRTVELDTYIPLNVNKKYIVTVNGTDYSNVSVSDYNEKVSLFVYSDTNETILWVNSYEDQLKTDVTVLASDVVGSLGDKCTISIRGNELVKIDPKFLPEDHIIELIQEHAPDSGGNVDLTSPEYFGAVGDGVTDDSAAIAQSLAASKNVVFDGTKTYLVGSTITVPADSYVDFRGATIVPNGNHDVIRVKPGSHIENLVVRCTDVPNWDSSVLVFYGEDTFSGASPTRIDNVKLFNDVVHNTGKTHKGNGLFIYADGFSQYIEGLSVTNVATCGFGRGVYIYSTVQAADDASAVFIGANNFRGYWSYKDTYGIYIDAKLPGNKTTNNFFTDLNIQSDYYGGSVYAIYCNGYSNYFSGCLYDYSILDYHPDTAVFFDVGSQENVVEVTAGKISEPGFCVDYGGANRVTLLSCDNINLPYGYASRSGMNGIQDDVLAFADKFADCTLESVDSEPILGNLSSVFDPSPKNYLAYRTSADNPDGARAIITINLKRVLSSLMHFVIQFKGSTPKVVKVTLYTAFGTSVIYNTKTNKSGRIVVTPNLTTAKTVYDVVKIVVELGGVNTTYVRPNGEVVGEWGLERIMAVDSRNTGNAWLRRDGGELCGNLKFQQSTGPVLTDANGKKYLLSVTTDGTLSVTEYQEQEEETPEAAALIPVMAAGPAWYNTDLAGAEQSSITSVAFSASYEPTGDEDASWACDEDGNGNIMAYRRGTAIIVVPTTGSESIQLNADSTYMFANDGAYASFSSLASITGTEMWIADDNTSMNCVCLKNTAITNPIHVPVGVIYLQNAFEGCTALTEPPVLPDGLISIKTAFISCAALQYLPEIPNTVTNINYAFQGCREAIKVPSTIPVNVHSMESAFRGCNKINGNIEINAANLRNYADCFLYACATSGSITLTGSCPQLAEIAATNTDGKVTVAT